MTARAFAVLLLWAGILAGCGKAERSFRIVTITDLTGTQAAYGQGIRLAAAMALKEQSAALRNAGWWIELSSFDAYGSTQDLSASVSRIAAQSEALCAVVHTATAGNLASAQILHAAGIPTVLPAETAPLPIGTSLPEILWLSPEDRAHGAGDADWIAAEDYTSVFLLLGPGEHAQAIEEGFLPRADTLGLTVSEARISPAQDSRAWIPSFKSAAPQLVYYSGSLEFVPSILGDLESAGFQGTLFIAESEAEDSLPKVLRSDKLLLYFSPATASSEDFSQSVEFAEKYRNAYAAEPPSLAALGYDAVTFCLLPLVGRNAADPSQTSPRAEIISRWRSGKVLEGIAVDYSFVRGRPCRTQVFTPSKDPGAFWIPVPQPDPAEGENSGC